MSKLQKKVTLSWSGAVDWALRDDYAGAVERVSLSLKVKDLRKVMAIARGPGAGLGQPVHPPGTGRFSARARFSRGG